VILVCDIGAPSVVVLDGYLGRPLVRLVIQVLPRYCDITTIVVSFLVLLRQSCWGRPFGILAHATSE